MRWLILAAFILLLGSCQTQPDVPLVPVAAPTTTTTTTTVHTPIMIITQAPPPTTTTTTSTTVAPPPKPKLPSISEPEYRNLFATVNDSFQDILFHGIDALLPEAFAMASAQFQSAKMNYEIQIWRWPYDGEAAYPFAGDLRNSGKSLAVIFEKGLPLRSDAEKAKAEALAAITRPKEFPSAVSERLAEARLELAAGTDSHTKAQYRSAIASFRRAILLFRSADARARAETLKSKVDENGYGRYSPYHAAEAERLLKEDAALYALQENEAAPESNALARGIDLLEKASRYYENILAWGAEREAGEARDRALTARQSADWLYSDLNAAEEYSGAAVKLSEAEARRESGHFNEAASLYDEAAAAFEAARLSSKNLECSAKASLEAAAQAVDNQKAKLARLEFDEDENLLEAEFLLASAGDKLTKANFAASRTDSLEALNQIAASESRLQARLSAQEAARKAAKQSEADRLAMEERLKAAEALRQAAEAKAASHAAQLAANAAELAAKSAELEALRAASAIREAEMRAKAEKDAAEKAALERQAAEARAKAQAAAQAAAKAEAARLEAERIAREAAAGNPEQRAVDAQTAVKAQAEAKRLATTEARSAIDEAKRHFERAVSKNAKNNYPEALAAGSKGIEAAKASLESGDPVAAAAKAKSASAILSGIKEYAELPAAYIVDLLPERKNKDSLTSIAGASYGYNDAWKWTILYEANKSILKDPSNPNLLLSGQVIVIPSIAGETRSGTWDPKKTYPVFGKR